MLSRLNALSRLRSVLLTIAAMLATCPGTLAQAQSTPAEPTASALLDRWLADLPSQHGEEARRTFTGRVRDLLMEEKFTELEYLAGKLRAAPFLRFADDRVVLVSFYAGVSTSSRELRTSQNVDDWRRRYDRWQAACPESPTVSVARADTQVGYAWSLRGSGYASSVSDDSWEKFNTELELARRILEDSDSPCPERRSQLLAVAMGQEWSDARYDQLFEEAVKAHPTYPPYYARKTYRLLPRWHGAKGELARWAKDETRRNRLGLGEGTYARIALFAVGYSSSVRNELFNELGFTWPELKYSFDSLLHQCPNASSLIDTALKFAWEEKDAEAARAWLALRDDERFLGPLTPDLLAQIEHWCTPATK